MITSSDVIIFQLQDTNIFKITSLIVMMLIILVCIFVLF